MTVVTRKPAFTRHLKKLTPEQKRQFQDKAAQLLDDLDAGRQPRPSLGVKLFRRLITQRVFEFAWATDGRAFFQYGETRPDGEREVIWLMVGTHAMYRNWQP